ncbi:uncharacterized protein LOC121383600 [Gigantopelta aegis]|uniref:uncharacterized protein LOC121383600 n=1 Tax=Gigantopelta aegis TaxID=1735272 RepID=UPI001B88A721|nr:uncharacterized protein LOC121383600 [Gigantopelta aegis]
MCFRSALTVTLLGVLVFGSSGFSEENGENPLFSTVNQGENSGNLGENPLVGRENRGENETRCVLNRTGLIPTNTPACCTRSCYGYCGQSHTITRSFKLDCNCDVDCTVFGDCCHDYYFVCLSWNMADITSKKKTFDLIHQQLQTVSDLKEKALTERLYEYKQCISNGNSTYFWMISSCPQGSLKSLATLCKDANLRMVGDFSCKDKCKSRNDLDPQHTKCQCDLLCMIFGDCCFDYYSECLNSTITETVKDGALDNITALNSVPPNELHHTAIQYLLKYRKYQDCIHYSDSTSVWMIAQCPPSYENHTITGKCMDAVLENNPVSHKRIQYITFRNKYCALCHNMSADNLEPWSSSVRCEEFTPDPQLSYSEIVEFLLKNCVLTVSPYSKPEMVRPCLPNTSILESEGELRTLCLFYQFPVTNQYNRISKNPHCSGSTKVENVQCFETSKKGESLIPGIGSLSILFSFDSESSDLTLNVTKDGRKIVVKSRAMLCEVDEVYNVFSESCTRLVCPIGKIPINGSCLIQGMHIINKDTQLLPNGSQFVYSEMNADGWGNKDSLLKWTFFKYGHIIERYYLSDFALFIKNIDKHRDLVIDDETFLKRIFELNVASINSKSDRLSTSVTGTISNALQNDFLSIRLSTNIEQFLSSISSSFIRDEYNMMFLNYLTMTNYKGEGNLTCAKGFLKKWLNPTFSVVDGTHYGNISNRYFPLNNVPFEMAFNISNSELKVFSILTCELSLDCSAVSYNKSEFEILNNTLYILDSGLILDSDHFILLGDTALVCSNFSRDYTYFENVKFFNFNPTQGIVTMATAIISIVCLVLTLAVYSLLTELRNVPGKLIMSLSMMLLISQCLLLLIKLPAGRLCTVFAVITHASWLSTFAWMTAIGANLAITFRVNSSGSSLPTGGKLYMKYALFAWGIPLCIVLTSAAVDFANVSGLSIGYGNGNVCWISNNTASLIVFGVPLAVLLVLNIACFLVTIYGIQKATKISKNISCTRKDRQTFWIYSKLFMITGLSWCFCFVAAFANIEAIWYVFIVSNNLQGLFVFLGFACTSRVLALLKKKYCSPEPEFHNVTHTTPVPFDSQATVH